MKYHIATAVLLLIALALYFAGLAGAGAVAFVAGVAFENLVLGSDFHQTIGRREEFSLQPPLREPRKA